MKSKGDIKELIAELKCKHDKTIDIKPKTTLLTT